MWRRQLPAKTLLPGGRDGSHSPPGSGVRLSDPLVPPRGGGLQGPRSPGGGGHRGGGVGGLVGVQGRGDGRDQGERRPAPGGGRAPQHPLGQPQWHSTPQPGGGEGDVRGQPRRHSGHARPGAALDHRESRLGSGARLDHRHTRARQDGRRGRVVGRSLLGLLEGRPGLQRRVAGVRPRRSGTPAAQRLRPRPGTATGERPMIALLLAQTIAITGGTVYPVSGPKLTNATVLVRDGKIVAVGTGVATPADAVRIDAQGKWVTPGLIDGAGQVGLVEIGAVAGTREGAVRGDTIAAAFNVAEGINPASMLIPVTRVEGITTVLATPTGNLVSGQAVLIDLDGATIEQMLVKSPAGMVLNGSETGKDYARGSPAAPAGGGRRGVPDPPED